MKLVTKQNVENVLKKLKFQYLLKWTHRSKDVLDIEHIKEVLMSLKCVNCMENKQNRISFFFKFGNSQERTFACLLL